MLAHEMRRHYDVPTLTTIPLAIVLRIYQQAEVETVESSYHCDNSNGKMDVAWAGMVVVDMVKSGQPF